MNTHKNNWHTLEQIKAMGNRVLTRKGDYGLTTQRGKTVTYWVQSGDKYYPAEAKTIN